MKITNFVLREKKNVGKGWPLSSNMGLEANIVAKSMFLSDEDEINPGHFMISGTDAFSRG